MIEFGALTPVLRSFDDSKAREFYVDFLGFSVGFEHRFSENSPLYMGVSRAGCAIHLSEHHGDACPGAHVRIKISDVNAFIRELQARNYRNAKPAMVGEATPWGTKEVTITDPFGNRLTFVEES